MANSVDLHTHTTMSDGALSPIALVEKASSLGIRILAITDHDTIDGIKPAQDAGLSLGIEIIPGVELTVEYKGQSMEILGYMFHANSQHLNDLLQQIKLGRMERARRTVERLSEVRVPILWERVIELAGNGVICRPHIAQAIAEAGYVTHQTEAFDKYLDPGKPAYVKGEYHAPLEVGIRVIHSAGGVAVIAHPILPNVPNYMDLNRILPASIEAGIDGIEAYYPGYTPQLSRELEKLALKHGLITTGGSDFHGEQGSPNCRLGDVAVPLISVSILKDRAAVRKRIDLPQVYRALRVTG